MKQAYSTPFKHLQLKKKLLGIIGSAFCLIFLPSYIFAQEPYYFHTTHSHGVSVIGGRTVKFNYMYQLSHNRQLKLSGTYIYDSYDQDQNHIKSKIFNSNVQLQFNVIHQGRLFCNFAFGAGGYHLSAKDLLNIRHNEWRIDFVAGFQAELYIVRNVLALTFDYDIFYMPWSKIYEFIHVPTGGLTIFFF